MAIIHRAELSPSKPEILQALFEDRGWDEPGPLEVLGAYLFDDPAGHVGVECHLVRTGATIFHLPLTYRPAPIEDADVRMVCTLQHPVLGERFVDDEIALDCFLRALCGAQQADLLVHDGDEVVEHRPQSVTLTLEVDEGVQVPDLDELLDGEPFTIARTVGDLDGAVRLVADWGEGRGVVAACRDERGAWLGTARHDQPSETVIGPSSR